MKHLLLTLLLTVTSTFVSAKDLTKIKFNDIDGKATSLADHAGKVVLLVNVASRCGNTPQYTGLQEVYDKYKEQGLVILAFPCNDFGAQEPGSPEEIKTFCSTKYSVTFPIMEKVSVKGSAQHPLFAALTGEKGDFPGDVKWNFGKFLIGRDGKAIERIEPKTKVESPEVIATIEKALAKKPR